MYDCEETNISRLQKISQLLHALWQTINRTYYKFFKHTAR